MTFSSPPVTRRPGPTFTIALLLLGILALTLRWHPAPPEVLYPDAATYMRQAAGYLEGQPSIAPPWNRLPAGGPIYPALTAVTATITGDVESGGRWVSRLSGLFAVLAVAWFTWLLAGPLAALAAGLLMAVEPRLIHFSEVGLTESLYLALWTGAMVLVWRSLQPQRRGWHEVAAGVLLGALLLTRAIGVVWLPLVLMVVATHGMAFSREGARLCGLRLGRIVVGATLLVLPYHAIAWQQGWTTAFDTHSSEVVKHHNQHSFVATTNHPSPAVPVQVVTATPSDLLKEAKALRATLYRQARELGQLFPPLIWLLAAVGVLARMIRPGPTSRILEVLLLGGGLGYLVALALFNTSLARYLLSLSPVIFIYAGFGILGLAQGLCRLLGNTPLYPNARRLAIGTLGGVALVGSWQLHAVYEVPLKTYPDVATLAQQARDTARLNDPVMVYANHAFMPYYLNGYWVRLPARPEVLAKATTPRLPAASKVVVLDAAYPERWQGWQEAVFNRTPVNGFYPVAQHYFPGHQRLLTVFADRPATADVARDDPLVLLAQGRLMAAQRAVSGSSPSATGHRIAALVEMIQGQYFPQRLAPALVHYQAAADSPDEATPDIPTTPRVYWSLPPGELYLGTGPTATRWNRAALLLTQRRADEAWQMLSPLTEHFSQDPRFHYLQGATLAAQGRFPAAIKALNTAVQGLPDDPAVAVAHANALAMGGRLPEAVTAYQDLLRKQPRNIGLWLNLAQAQWMLGDSDASRRAILRAKKLPKSDANKRRIKALFNRLQQGQPAGQ